MNVEIGAEASPFPEKEYISGIFVAVYKGRKEKKTTNFWVNTGTYSKFKIFCFY
jgi:hypothetical protein